MKGFLAGLAARSTGNERVLEPRRLLFEPREDAPLEQGLEQAQEPVAGPPRRQGPAPRSREQPRPPLAPQAEGEERETPDRERPPVDGAAPPQLPSAARVPSRPVQQPTGAPPQPVPEDAQDGVSEVVARLPARPQARETRPEAPRPPLTARREPTPASRLRARRAPPPVTESSSARERIVRITIGRIEVRALHAPDEKTESKPAPAPKHMSLQEYLARGSRR